jgi:alpha-beta hydrolase superfamily lysophospholipase
LSFLIFTILSVIVFSTVSNAERLQFKHGGTQLSGHYFLPYNCAKNNSAKAVIIFVHGDGGVTYDANGYYRFIWKYLRVNGYAIFSWDKPGTGK